MDWLDLRDMERGMHPHGTTQPNHHWVDDLLDFERANEPGQTSWTLPAKGRSRVDNHTLIIRSGCP